SRALHWDKSEFEPMIVPGGTISRETLLYSVECEQENLAPTLAPSWNGEEVEERDTDQVRAAIDLCHSGSLEDARAALAAKLDDMAERRRFDSFGIGPIVCFLLAGENECRALRVLFAKKRAAQQKA
ncbi:MAG: V-type ATPase subunit, partial [Oscillospiraceae bacterium]